MNRSHLERRLDLLLEDPPDDPYQIANDLAVQLEQARRQVTDLERQLLHAVDRLCGGLAMGVRRAQPGLNVGLDKGCCKVGYRAKHLAMRPDFTKKTWIISSGDPRFARRFMRGHAPTVGLSNDLGPIAKAIADFFTGHYLSLGESISGRGIIMIDGRSAQFAELALYIKERERLLTEDSTEEVSCGL